MAHTTSHAAPFLSRAGILVLFLAAQMLALTAGAAPYLGPEDEPIRLNANVTVTGSDVRLGDLFSGHPDHEEKVVAAAPAPGQRMVLDTDWLTNLARTYGIEWHPADAYDRAIVYRSGRTVTPSEILAAFKDDLVTKGMPANTGLAPGAPLPTLTVPSEANPPFSVREAFFDPTTKNFSAVAEFTGPEGQSQFLQVRGTGFNTVTVPVLKSDVTRPQVITPDMIVSAEIPDGTLKHDIIVDAENLIGKSPITFLRAGQPVHDTEIARLNLVDVPVLRNDMNREDIIGENNVTWLTVDANTLPPDAVTTAPYLIGKSPRHIVAGGTPIRRGDVIAAQQEIMAVASRDLPLGEAFRSGDVDWVPVGEDSIGAGVIVSEADITGRVTTRPIRAGQPIRAIDVTRPTVIPKDKLVTMIYATPIMTLTVRGKALEDGAAAQTIRVANANSNKMVLAEVVDADTVRVVSQQSAMR
ncbi:MAG: flagellar basal body P-ring formation protein FlgA [Rhodospirillaceae bacterium]|nr:MAG: flagellar basal body P-ring formation protein FlgA [Rhodospirillaceae bacterium]